MGKLRRTVHEFRFKGVLVILFVFALIASVLYVELTGVRVNYATKTLTLLPDEAVKTKEQALSCVEKDMLLIWDSGNESSIQAMKEFEVILTDMKEGYEALDLNESLIPTLDSYQSVILLLSDLTVMGDQMMELCDWVYEGGAALLPLTLEENAYSAAVENRLGIQETKGHTYVDEMYIADGFMIGGGRAFAVPDAYDSARTVRLREEGSTVYVSEGNAQGVPLIWESSYGQGKFVVDNFGIYDKAFRGFFAASISLLTDIYLYPVINGSVFYLDDFPSQIPEGKNEYISRDYNTNVRDFYLNIWWPDMMNLADQYGLKYSGLAIACYDDAVDGTTDASPDKSTFLQIGNMILRKGGELGYHGYNHQPLALGDRDYHDIFDYKTWDSYDAMKQAFDYLEELCEELFPDVPFSVYVPPSNLLTGEGKAMLMKEYPGIRTYSGIYLPDDVLEFTLLQEFEVDEEGIVEQPRIVSGCDLDDFMTLGALSELNMHLVNNHFTHPDDALDPDRGAKLGWEELCSRFEEYLQWLYSSVPQLRNLTGTECSAAIQRFAAAAPHTELQSDAMIVTIENFYDEAQFLVRFNEHTPDSVIGGELTHITGNLYLLSASEAVVTVKFH